MENENVEEIEEIQEEVTVDVSEENVQEDETTVVAYDYYETYYTQVLEKLDTITGNQQTIIYNQEQQQLVQNNIKTSIDTLCFSVIIILCYMFINKVFHL